jgi:pyruvate dehydrogenase E1 component alpha subunit
LWRLPLVLVCSNNGYAVSTPVSQGIGARRLADLAAPFGIPARQLDGSDVDEVARVMGETVAEVRGGLGLRFVEVMSTRLATHSTLTREERTAAEMEGLAARDPLLRFERDLRAEGLLDDALSAAMQAEVDLEIAGAERFAAEASWPDAAEAVTDA